MGYMHIDNLYKPSAQGILLFRECFAMEKLHGTSAHITWSDGQVGLSPGGVKLATFAGIFDSEGLADRFVELGHDRVVVFGEAYGGACQKMSDTYGTSLRFAAFEVRIGDAWLSVPNAADVAAKLGLDFVPFVRTPTDLAALDALRDSPSEQAVKNGVAEVRPREGIVLRPIDEFLDARGERVIAKHKGAAFRERASVPRVETDPAKRERMAQAGTIVTEWVTDTRMAHVLDALGGPSDISATGAVVKAMTADVLREADGLIVEGPEVRKAIGSAAARMFKARLTRTIGG